MNEYKSKSVALTNECFPTMTIVACSHADGMKIRPALGFHDTCFSVSVETDQETASRLRQAADYLDAAWAMYQEGQK